MTRRLVAAGVLIVFIALLFFGLKSCADNRRDRALKDYNRNVAQIAGESQSVANQFFETLNGGGAGQDLEGRISQVRLKAEEQVKSAQNLDVPGQMQRAQNMLELSLNLRETAYEKIAAQIKSAQADNRQTAEAAVNAIAGQMEQFLASDVIYSQRVIPLIAGALADADIGNQNIAKSVSLPDIGWLDVNSVADVLGAKRGNGGTGADPNPAPGSHGHGITSVSIGQTALVDGQTNRIAAGSNPTFNVKFQNQGENPESDVVVQVTVKPGSGKAITVPKTVNQTSPDSGDVEVNIPLGRSIPAGTAATVTVEVKPVPGEKNVDNNKAEYTVLFTS